MAEKFTPENDPLIQALRAHDPLTNKQLPEAEEATLWRATATKPTRTKFGMRLRRPAIRWAAPFAATAVLALAVGASVGSLNKPATPLFSLAHGSASASGQKLASGMSESSTMAGGDAKIGLWYGQTFEYSAADGLDTNWNDSGSAYRLVAPSSPERILNDLGEIFGVAGKIARQDGGEGNPYTTYSLGNTDGTEKAIWLYWGPAPSWSFYDPSTNFTPKCLKESAEGCVEFDNTPPDASLLPNSSKMKGFASKALSAIGLKTNQYRLNENRDNYGAYLRAELLAGSTPVAIETYFSWNQLGLTSAGGTLGSLEKVSDVPVIAPSKAVARITDWRWSGGLPGSFWDANSPAVSMPTTKDIAEQPADATAPAEPTEPGAGGEPGTGSGPVATPDPIKVTIDKFESRLMVVWSAQGGIWVVPGYVFSSSDSQVAGQWFAILAVADGVITMPEPEQGAVTY